VRGGQSTDRDTAKENTMVDDRPDDYNDVIERVKNDYEERIVAFLNRCRDYVIGLGIPCTDVHDMSDDYFRFTFSTTHANGLVSDGDVDFTLEIAEAASYGDEPTYGVNFGLDIVEYGGRVLGGLQPFNFTDACWVDATDADALRARWQYFEDASVDGIRDLIVVAG
jgi:hypothetical protein